MIGGICGAFELQLLQLLVHSVQAGETGRVALISFGKLLLLACAFVPVILFLREDLLWCGIGISIALVLGAFLRFLIGGKKNKQEKGDA